MTLICQVFRSNKPLPKDLTDRKLKMSTVFIFEIKDVKKDKIFNFLNDRFSAMGKPIDTIFGAFLEAYVRLLKTITLQFFSRYSKSYNNLNVNKSLKTQRPLTKRRTALEPPNQTYLIQLYKCSQEWSWWTLRHLQFLRYCLILFPCKIF